MKVNRVIIEFDHADEANSEFTGTPPSKIILNAKAWTATRALFLRDLHLMSAIDEAVRKRDAAR